ncbi:hypothetical protein [Acetivibrio cellulolyticus]|uniref:hypothetical protein n=1 Tax=Acetivibrio cellulolyticus TaxID=35830 RepID=UPI0001E304C2|nr:hypothetical protein [Acetivibrio cellulolyticus]
MKNQYQRFYILSVAIILIVSVYPIFMVFKVLASYLNQGFVTSDNYPKYVIPYAPIGIALILVVCLMPVIYKLFKRWSLLASSILGAVVFFICEIGFERISVVESQAKLPLESWQLSLCIATPEVLRAIGNPIYAQNNPAYKVHFYLISIIIILAVVNVVCGFTKMFREKDFSKKIPLVAQLISVVIFIGLCILACFTAFYRNGTINISALSATLMCIFFIVFGVTFGVYIGSIFFGKKKILSVVVPMIASIATTVAMYIGELILMDGKLYRFGSGFLFEPIGSISFAVIDFIVIFVSGATTYFITLLINHKRIYTNFIE